MGTNPKWILRGGGGGGGGNILYLGNGSDMAGTCAPLWALFFSFSLYLLSGGGQKVVWRPLLEILKSLRTLNHVMGYNNGFMWSSSLSLSSSRQCAIGCKLKAPQRYVRSYYGDGLFQCNSYLSLQILISKYFLQNSALTHCATYSMFLFSENKT